MERFRIAVGHAHNVKPANIVGAIINEAGLASEHIGQIKIYDDYSTVDLPEGMPNDVFMLLKKVWVSGQQMQISRPGDETQSPMPRKKKQSKKERRKAGRK
jgi:ATP-dependent RNA helicase DeaD